MVPGVFATRDRHPPMPTNTPGAISHATGNLAAHARSELRDTNGLQKMIGAIKAIVVVVILATATSLSAETLSFPAFRIDLPDDWEYGAESRVDNSSGQDRQDVLTLRHPDGVRSLKLLSYDAPDVVAANTLRNMTNVDASTPLTWQHWGDYSGYQYDYVERGSFYRQWWLVHEQTLLFITYQGNPGSKVSNTAEIDTIIRSLTARIPPPE